MKTLFAQGIGDRLSETLAAALDEYVGDALVDIIVKVKTGFFAVFGTTELTGNGTGFFGFIARGERGVRENHRQ